MSVVFLCSWCGRSLRVRANRYDSLEIPSRCRSVRNLHLVVPQIFMVWTFFPGTFMWFLFPIGVWGLALVNYTVITVLSEQYRRAKSPQAGGTRALHFFFVSFVL